MKAYRAAVIGCSRMGGFIDHEVVGMPGHVPPYSHGAGFFACDRTDLVGCSDLRTDVMEEFGKLYEVPKEGHYTDYHDLINEEELDIVSVATQPEHRAEIVIYAAEHGVKAIYAEKALSASMDEADAIVSAVEANGAILNMGTNRRWHPGFDKMKEVIDSGELGALRSVIIYNNGTLFNTSSHTFDLAMRLNSDCPVAWAQGHLPGGSGMFEGDILKEDPRAHGMFQFENGVTVYPMLTAAWSEYSVICEGGIMSALNNGIEWQLRKKVSIGPKGRSGLEEGTYPAFEEASSTLKLVEDLVHSLDTGEPPRGGVQIARANTELIFAFIESELQGGARVELPLTGSRVRLQRDGAPKQPMLAPNEL